jgi:RNA polymerase sigma factor (sigma-70 family)
VTLAEIPPQTPASPQTGRAGIRSVRSSCEAPHTFEERAALFLEIQPLVRSLHARYSGDPELIQELPGEIYFRFHGLLDRYDSRRGVPVRAYLLRCLQLGIHSWVRSHWRRRRREVELTDWVAESCPGSSADPAEAIGESAHREELIRSLRRAIRALPPRQREVLIARYYKSASYKEISLNMGIGQATVRSLVRFGIMKVRNRLEYLRLKPD